MRLDVAKEAWVWSQTIEVSNWVGQLAIRAAAVADVHHHQISIRQLDNRAIAITNIKEVQFYFHNIHLRSVIIALLGNFGKIALVWKNTVEFLANRKVGKSAGQETASGGE
jgi:hypothetical protein